MIYDIVIYVHNFEGFMKGGGWLLKDMKLNAQRQVQVILPQSTPI